MFISIIAAMDRNRVIGRNNQMPWYLPADFKYFKRITLGKPIIMGRKTYDSIGHPLPGRRNIIISHNAHLQIPDCEVLPSLEKALKLFEYKNKNEDEVFIIGGASLFEQALPFANRLYFTFIDGDFAGDTYFPEWQQKDWQEMNRDSHKADASNPYNYHFVVLKPIAGNR